MSLSLRRMLVLLSLLLLLSTGAEAATTFQLATRSATTVYTTDLNTKASNAWIIASAVINNTIGGAAGEGYMRCYMELALSFAANPTANGAFVGWFLKTVDGGTTYEDTPNGTVTLNRLPDMVLPVNTGGTTTRVTVETRCPAGNFKIAGQLSGTGQTTSGSGNSLKIFWATPQGN